MVHTVTTAVHCGHPLRDRVLHSGSGTIKVMDYMAPALEGATVTFGCAPQYILMGPNTTTCMENGEWEPDPSEVECKGIDVCMYNTIILKYDS